MTKHNFHLLIAISGFFSLAQAAPCFSSTVTLRWDAEPNTSVVGYRVYYQQDSPLPPLAGTGAAQGSSPIDVHNQTGATLSGLDPSRAYYFAVTAYTATGLESDYSNVAAIPELVPPTVSLTAPAPNTMVAGTASVTVSAADNAGVTRVEYYVNNVMQGADTSPPYLYSWDTSPLSGGSYLLSAKAYDAAGNVGQSAGVTVNVVKDTTPPSVALTSPGNNARVSGTVTVSASASDDVGISRVEFYQGSSLLAAGNVPPYSCSWNSAALSDGRYSLGVRAYDASGNTSESTVAVTTSNTLVCPNQPVLVAGYTYPDLQSGYQQVANNAVLGLEAVSVPGDLVLNRDITVKLQGGYDCGYTALTGATSLQGKLVVAAGTARIDLLYFK